MNVYVRSVKVSDTCIWVHRYGLDFKAAGNVVSEGGSDGASLYELKTGDAIDFLPDNTAVIDGVQIGTWSTPTWPKNACIINPIIPT